MPRFAANLTMMYPDLPFLERFEAAARDGFKAVEYLFPYAHPAAELAARLKGHGLQQVLFNMPPGGATREAMVGAWDRGERGMMVALRGTEIVTVPLAEALAAPKLLDPQLYETAEVFFG